MPSDWAEKRAREIITECESVHSRTFRYVACEEDIAAALRAERAKAEKVAKEAAGLLEHINDAHVLCPKMHGVLLEGALAAWKEAQNA